MTASSALYIPPYKAGDQDIVVGLNFHLGAEAFTVQPTRTGMSVLWVPREGPTEVLTFLRQVPKPYVMLYDLRGVDERLHTHHHSLPNADFSVFYHPVSLERNSDVMIEVALSKYDLNLSTATRIWPSASWYGCEVQDMCGIIFVDHSHLTRMLMSPTQRGHPLRKDYPARATKFDPYSLSAARQDLEQEALRLKPKDWGMKRHGENEDYMFLNLDPSHPSVHGVLRIILRLNDEETIDCVPEISCHHRSTEKMAERQSWYSFIPYTDRIDYLGGAVNNLPYALSVEKLIKIKVPQRVDMIRIMMAEFFHILSHPLYLDTYTQDVDVMTPVFFISTDCRCAYKVVEAITGFRLHPAWYRIGGAVHDPPHNWDRLVCKFPDWISKRLDEYGVATLKDGILRGRTIGVAQYNIKETLKWGTTGAGLRAIGCDFGLCKVCPYSGYENFELEVLLAHNGDAYDRCMAKMGEMRRSLRIIEQRLKNMPKGPHKVDHPLTMSSPKKRTL